MSDAVRRLRRAAGSWDLGFRAPGRANLIGEHTDYNDGFVLPVALEMATYAVGRRADRLRLRSLDEPGEVDVDLDSVAGPEEGWGRYATAVVRALRDEGVRLEGFAGTLASDVPVGSGLSSSAALEVAIASTLVAEPLAPARMARVCQRAENAYVGVQCGIMDQFASVAGRYGHALLLDCRSEQVEHVAVPDGIRVLLVDSALQRGLSGSAYNERRSQCEAAADALGVASLRDADLHALERAQGRLDETTFRRARHVISENRRVLEAVGALRAGRLDELGSLFAASHRSLRDDYAVSTPELDTLVEIAAASDGVLATRLTGAGFGGCTVSLVHGESAGAAAASIVRDYERATGRASRAWVTRPAGGAGPWSADSGT